MLAMYAFASALPFFSRLPDFTFARADLSGEDCEAEFLERRVAFLRRFLPDDPFEETEAAFFRRLRPPDRDRPKPCVAISCAP